jgi:tetratricopeptide (TPR) repeat protein
MGKTVLYAVISFQIISTASWILLNTDESRSISRYMKIAALDNKRSRLGFNRLGDYFLERQRWQEAENALLLSLKVGPHYRSYLGLGVAQKNLGKYNEAVEAFSNVLKLSPEEPLALFELGLYYYSIGDLEKSRELFLKLQATPLGSRDARLARMLDDIEHRLYEGENTDR